MFIWLAYFKERLMQTQQVIHLTYKALLWEQCFILKYLEMEHWFLIVLYFVENIQALV